MVTVPIIPRRAPPASIGPHSAPPISSASPCRWPGVATWMAVKIPTASSHAEQFIMAGLPVSTGAVPVYGTSHTPGKGTVFYPCSIPPVCATHGVPAALPRNWGIPIP